MENQPAVSDGDITQLLRQWGDGRDEAFRELLPLAYDRLRSLAGGFMRRERPDHTLQPTALVGELLLAAGERQSVGLGESRALLRVLRPRHAVDPYRSRQEAGCGKRESSICSCRCCHGCSFDDRQVVSESRRNLPSVPSLCTHWSEREPNPLTGRILNGTSSRKTESCIQARAPSSV